MTSGQALVAQLAEHFLGKEEVTGSIPVKGYASPWQGSSVQGMRPFDKGTREKMIMRSDVHCSNVLCVQ